MFGVNPWEIVVIALVFGVMVAVYRVIVRGAGRG